MNKRPDRKPDFSLTIKDFEVQTFRAGGPGGQNQNKVESGVRLIHQPSGARAESREFRTQLENKRAAFKKIANSPKLRFWLDQMCGIIKTDAQIEAEVEKDLKAENLKIEVKQDNKWTIQ